MSDGWASREDKTRCCAQALVGAGQSELPKETLTKSIASGCITEVFQEGAEKVKAVKVRGTKMEFNILSTSNYGRCRLGFQVRNQGRLPFFKNGNRHSICENWIVLVKDNPVFCIGTATDSGLPALRLLRDR